MRLLYLGLFLFSLIGLLFLTPQETSVEEMDMGRLYKVCGILTPLRSLERGCLYRFTDGKTEIKAVAFFGGCKSGFYCIYARKDVYRGEEELVILAYS